MTLPLQGVKIIDLSRNFPGPYCTMFLADLGADVLRVEGSRFKEDVRMDSVMRNKRHMTLNLDKSEARTICFRLIEGADVFVEGFRPGVCKRLGMDYDSLRVRYPRLIYCSITGYGQESPYSAIPGHDINYQGFGGVLHLNRRQGEEPVIPPLQIGDMAGGGMQAAIAILSALFDRERTGKGRYIDIAMTDGIIAMLHTLLFSKQMRGQSPAPGADSLTGRYACYQVYETKDGLYLTIGILEPHLWKNLCDILGCPQYSPDQFVEGERQREIQDFFRHSFLQKTRDEWFERLKDRNVCVGKVLDLDEVLQDDHTRQRNLIWDWPQPDKTTSPLLGSPIKMSEAQIEMRQAPAEWGEHTEEVLTELGFRPDQIQQFRQDDII
jgi:crotonobetainyl-CoA:carnitine CoA-transferase CaiB-like acyl-CoA transferase